MSYDTLSEPLPGLCCLEGAVLVEECRCSDRIWSDSYQPVGTVTLVLSAGILD